MGSWDETCVLTNVGIRRGDRAVRVRLSIPSYGHYRILDGGFGSETADLRYVVDITEGCYNEQGGFADSTDRAAQEAERPFVIGRYGNDESEKGTRKYSIFFHAAAWAWAQQVGPTERASWQPTALQRLRYAFDEEDFDRRTRTHLRTCLVEEGATAEVLAAFDAETEHAAAARDARVQMLLPLRYVLDVLNQARMPFLPPVSGPQQAAESYAVQDALHVLRGTILAEHKAAYIADGGDLDDEDELDEDELDEEAELDEKPEGES